MEKTIIIVPTYWKKGLTQGQESLYDHPADLLEGEETLSRAIESFNNIHGTFDVLVLGIPTHNTIGDEMDEYLSNVLKSCQHHNFDLMYFGWNNFQELKVQLQQRLDASYWEILSNRGYGNVRNLCLFLAHVLGYSICVLIDDDEIIVDKNFLDKVLNAFRDNEGTGLVLGYYLNGDGSLLLSEEATPPWLVYWDKIKYMNEAFRLILDSQERYIRPPPFALGGNMAVHHKCWTKVPFDPLIPRGEDMDYLRNSIYFGLKPVLDTELSIVHLPPKSNNESDHKFYQDIFRFIYSKYKLQSMGMSIEQFDPYPGYFLRDTEGKAYLTEVLKLIFDNPEKFLVIKDEQGLKELIFSGEFVTTQAIEFAKHNFSSYLKFQRIWIAFVRCVSSTSFHINPRKISF
ncbi:MAG: hypothetical protein ACTSW1_00890 [Candidatus Hodarchaeales archaeon]